ncbi:MAG: phasin family protein [Rhodospirillales bacterium]
MQDYAAFNPFKDFDVTKMMGDMKIPTVDFEALAATQRKNFEAFTAANQTAYNGFQALIQRQAEVLRTSFEDMSSSFTDLMSAGSPEEKATKHADMLKVSYEKAIANGRQILDMVARNNSEAFDVLNKRVTESLDEVKGLVAKKV